MPVTKEDATWIALVVSWVVWLFGLGRVYGTLESRVSKNEKDISAIAQKFRTQDGEPRLMSFKAHDKIQSACQKRMDERQAVIDRTMAIHDEKLDKILEAVSALKAHHQTTTRE